ncbi:MAG: sulfatase-like hydrolase/transferase, partial [Deltaproteobacteria bacterium]|nr:sulfatase-like hydrolase/transferase [Deltaproteobacteria bacterium]
GKLTPQQQRPYNVLWVMVDALRAKSMSLYGYERETTPFLSNLAKEAWVFDNAYSQSSNTSLSAPSMFSGRNPASIDWRQGKYYPEPKEGHVVIAQVASQVDYSTSIAVNYRVRWRLPGMLTGHETIRTAPKSESWHSGEYTVLNTIKGIAAARSENKPFFATAHFDDVHQPYVGGNDHAVPKFGHRDKAVAGYDRGIAAFDNMLQILVDHLRNEELWEETILVVTSDHGEEFGERPRESRTPSGWSTSCRHCKSCCSCPRTACVLMVKVCCSRCSLPVRFVRIARSSVRFIKCLPIATISSFAAFDPESTRSCMTCCPERKSCSIWKKIRGSNTTCSRKMITTRRRD